jgi:hypothetical protein
MEAWRLKVEPWTVCRPVVAGSHHLTRNRIRIRRKVENRISMRIKVKSLIRIRIKVKKGDPNLHESFRISKKVITLMRIRKKVMRIRNKLSDADPQQSDTDPHRCRKRWFSFRLTARRAARCA